MRTLTVASLAAVAALTAMPSFGAWGQVSKDFHFTYDLPQNGRLDLTNTNGSVEVTGWDRNSIDVSGTKYAPDEEALQAIQVDVNVHGDTARIETKLPHRNSWHGSYGVRYRIHVPRKIRLDRLETTNGEITAENLEGGGRLNSTNGKLTLTHLSGDYNATTTNGNVIWEECMGSERSETTNGSVQGHIKAGSIEASSTNGSVDLTLEDPSEGKPVRVSTTNGSVSLAMAAFHNNSVKAETTNGSVNLRLPESTNAHLSAQTTMANISTDLALSSTEENSKHNLRGLLGHGGSNIDASSTMGSVRIQRY